MQIGAEIEVNASNQNSLGVRASVRTCKAHDCLRNPKGQCLASRGTRSHRISLPAGIGLLCTLSKMNSFFGQQ